MVGRSRWQHFLCLTLGALLIGEVVDAQERVSFATEDRGLVSGDVYGTGSRGVVLAHGYRFDKNSWKPQALRLADAGYRVLAFDFRGYGASKGPGDAEPLRAPLDRDVLAAVRYLRATGATEVSVIGASMGAEFAARAAAQANADEIQQLVLLSGGVNTAPGDLRGRKLFVVSKEDPDSSGEPRLKRIEESYAQTSEPKKLLILEGSAHAQAIFTTPQGAAVMDEIVSFLAIPRETCSRTCLIETMTTFLDAALKQRYELVPLSPNVRIRENTRETSLPTSVWRRVSGIVSQQVFADPLTGNVVARMGVRLEEGKIAYVSTRLRVVDRRVEEIEMGFDDSKRVIEANIVKLDPVFTTLVPEQERSTREQIERIGRSYFQALTDHQPVVTDFDDRCDRYHSGQRVTNNVTNSVEGGGPRSCVESFAGPWGPAVEHRFPIIDPDRGVLVGYTLLHFPNDQRMYVSEVFKILDGRIRLIDNIGIMMSGTGTTGFPAQ